MATAAAGSCAEGDAAAKAEFLSEYGAAYGYGGRIDELRAAEFRRLDGLVYLDHAGAGLYSEAQMSAVAQDFCSNVYGNPHSQNDSSVASSDIIHAARQQVLSYFNAPPKDYKCIFTSGATAALKLIGECFPWSQESCYMYTSENHNSVLGIREYALNRGATALAVDLDDSGSLSGHETYKESYHLISRSKQRRTQYSIQHSAQETVPPGHVHNLFAFPSECNFSGRRFPLRLVQYMKEEYRNNSPQHQGSWMVLIDAAKGCATAPPNLTKYPADFVVFSFYKIFGYPTGLGALILRNEAANFLEKTYFSGGTVSAAIADIDFVRRRHSIEQIFEDGTISFLGISSIRHGFKLINTLAISGIEQHTSSLATYTADRMMNLKHQNGHKVCEIYGRCFSKTSNIKWGPTIAFNLKREDGSWVGYREVEKLASLSSIHLRTGCFCNPGSCAKYLCLNHSDLISNFEAGHVCWDDNDVLNGKPTGGVRISFGYMSTFEDAQVFLKFLESSFVSKSTLEEENIMLSKIHIAPGVGQHRFATHVCLKSITIYPIKSCSGFSVQNWPLGSGGLRFDREWLLRGQDGEIFTQKKVPEMKSIHTLIDLKVGYLYVESPNCKQKLQISLMKELPYLIEGMEVYGQRYDVRCYGKDVNSWFTTALRQPCTFIRCSSSQVRSCTKSISKKGPCRDAKSKLSFVNEGQLLLVSEDSLLDLNRRLNSGRVNGVSIADQPMQVDSMRFRPNLVISGSPPYCEDNWKQLQIAEAHFTSLGGCNRCQMVNIDQQSEQVLKSKEPLATLASYRRKQGKILFGILLRYDDTQDGEGGTGNEIWLKVGQEVLAST